MFKKKNFKCTSVCTLSLWKELLLCNHCIQYKYVKTVQDSFSCINLEGAVCEKVVRACVCVCVCMHTVKSRMSAC